MNNIFKYSPKELSTDAFLHWYITELDINPKLRGKSSTFFHELGLCGAPKELISNIQVKRQEKNTDLTIRYLVDGKKTGALFENKIYTSTHSDQLKRYKADFRGFSYKYMKLGYINYAERREAELAGYDVIDVYQLKSALEKVPFNNVIVDQYKEFLHDQFIEVQKDIKENLISANKHHLFKDSQAQQYILSKLHEKIDGLTPDLDFHYAANLGGTPWTQLYIAKRDNAYGNKAEYLILRIDKRGKGYYLRLSQYSDIDSKDSMVRRRKEENLKELRKNITPLFDSKGIVLGKTSNSGVKESEIVILFFEDNHLAAVTKHLPILSKEIYKFYSLFKNWV